MKILRNKKFLTVMAMVLMVAMVVGMGTMTYARYVSSASMANPESATVADWGYVLSVDTSKMFGDAYEENVVTAYDAGGNLDIKAAAEATKLVAPGSSGYMTVDVSGNAEVLAKFTIAVANGYTDVVLKFTDSTADYYPIVWTLEKTVGGNTQTVKTGHLSDIVTALGTQSATIAAGQTIALTQYKISWEWKLGAAGIDDTNKKDTALGMLAADKDAAAVLAATGLAVSDTNSVLKIKLDISATVEQIQD